MRSVHILTALILISYSIFLVSSTSLEISFGLSNPLNFSDSYPSLQYVPKHSEIKLSVLVSAGSQLGSDTLRINSLLESLHNIYLKINKLNCSALLIRRAIPSLFID
jgi:hypothetical protein